jgi:ParB-like chromosome segregation protein Spo0J
VSAVAPVVSLELLRSEVQTVPISLLQPGYTPRLAGEDLVHATALADCEADLPPILVHRPTMRVIDGMHRLRAAQLRGRTEIEVRFFRGPEEAAFVLAVQANTTHGLPLTLSDREAAAARILRSHPHWSDRAIASSTGLAARTVSAIRSRLDESVPQATMRVGRDGRVRPLNAVEGRLRAHAVIQQHPQATLREIAKASGVSLGTARDVRQRVRQGMDPLPGRHQQDRPGAAKRAAAARHEPSPDCNAVLQNLRKDPSLRFTDSGRNLLRLLDSGVSAVRDCNDALDAIPPHCLYHIQELARGAAAEWLDLANRLQVRTETARRDDRLSP